MITRPDRSLDRALRPDRRTGRPRRGRLLPPGERAARRPPAGGGRRPDRRRPRADPGGARTTRVVARGERLKTVPRGYDADHPRIDLLRHKTLTLRRDYGFEPFVHTPALLNEIRKDWRAARPFLTWVQDAAG